MASNLSDMFCQLGIQLLSLFAGAIQESRCKYEKKDVVCLSEPNKLDVMS